VWAIGSGGWPNIRLCASEPPRRPPSWGNEGEWLTSLFLFFSPQLCLQTSLWCGKLKRASVSISPYVQPHSSTSSPSSPALLLSQLFFSTVDPGKQSTTLFHHNNSATHSLPPGPRLLEGVCLSVSAHRRTGNSVCICAWVCEWAHTKPTTNYFLTTPWVYVCEWGSPNLTPRLKNAFFPFPCSFPLCVWDSFLISLTVCVQYDAFTVRLWWLETHLCNLQQ